MSDQMTDDQFYADVALLNEASRLDYTFAERVLAAKTDADIDELVAEARLRVAEAAREAY